MNGCERKGVRGNEHFVHGQLMCDYCHAEFLDFFTKTFLPPERVGGPVQEVIFAPGCFDNLPDDMTQEEIEQFKQHLEEMFLNMTEEELEANCEVFEGELPPPKTRQ